MVFFKGRLRPTLFSYAVSSAPQLYNYIRVGASSPCPRDASITRRSISPLLSLPRARAERDTPLTSWCVVHCIPRLISSNWPFGARTNLTACLFPQRGSSSSSEPGNSPRTGPEHLSLLLTSGLSFSLVCPPWQRADTVLSLVCPPWQRADTVFTFLGVPTPSGADTVFNLT